MSKFYLNIKWSKQENCIADFSLKNKIKHTQKKLVDFDSVNIVQDKFFLGRIKIY